MQEYTMVMKRLPRLDSLEWIIEAARADEPALLSILQSTSDKVLFTQEFCVRVKRTISILNARFTEIYAGDELALARWRSLMHLVRNELDDIHRILALEHIDPFGCILVAKAMGFINAFRATYERTLGIN